MASISNRPISSLRCTLHWLTRRLLFGKRASSEGRSTFYWWIKNSAFCCFGHFGSVVFYSWKNSSTEKYRLKTKLMSLLFVTSWPFSIWWSHAMTTDTFKPASTLSNRFTHTSINCLNGWQTELFNIYYIKHT